jgi:hypothetical protein
MAVTLDRRLFRFCFQHPGSLQSPNERQRLMLGRNETASSASIFLGVTLDTLQVEVFNNIAKSEITHVSVVDPLTLVTGTRQGSVFVTTLPTLHDFGNSRAQLESFELKDTGMFKSLIQRYWSSSSSNDVLGIACLDRRNDSIIFSLSEDDKIRAWSLRDKRMMLSVSLPTETWDEKAKSTLPSTPGKAARSAGVAAPLAPSHRTIRFWSNEKRDHFKIAVYSVLGDESQFAIFDGYAAERDDDISLSLSGISYMVHADLIDFQVSHNALWTLWKTSAGFSAKRLPLATDAKTALELNAWQEIALEDIDDSIDLLYEFDPSIENYPEIFLANLFEPGRFSLRSLQRGLNTFEGRKPYEEVTSTNLVQELRVVFADAVANSLGDAQSNADVLGSYGVYLQWLRLLNGVTDAWLAENEPCGIFILPGDVVGLTNSHTSSIFVPCDNVDSTYLRSHVLSVEEVGEEHTRPVMATTSDVDSLLSAVQFCAAHLSPAVITEFNDAVRNYADPIDAANTYLVQSLISVISPIVSANQASADSNYLGDQSERRPNRSCWRAKQLERRLSLVQDGRDQARRSRHLFISRFMRRFRAIGNPVAAIEDLLSMFYEPDSDDGMAVASSEYIAGETIENIVIRGARLSTRSRFSLLRNLAACLLVAARIHPKSGLSLEHTEALSSRVFPLLNRLLREHAIMFFATRELALVTRMGSPEISTDSVDTIDFSELNFGASDRKDFSDQNGNVSLDLTVPFIKLYLASVRVQLLTRAPGSTHHLVEISKCIDDFMSWLRPCMSPKDSFNLTVFSCAKENEQYSILRDFIIILNDPSATTKHLLGLAQIGLGDKEAALECFMQAGLALQDNISFLDGIMGLPALIAKDSNNHEIFLPSAESGLLLKQLTYWRYLGKYFEEKHFHDVAVQCSLAAISHLQSHQHKQGPKKSVFAATVRGLWIDVFTSTLSMEDFEQAYLATINVSIGEGHQDHLDCLRQLLVVMCEKQCIRQLAVDFPYVGLMEEVNAILLQRARLSPIFEAPNFYHVLYSVHVHRGNYLRAAQLSYECAERLLLDAHSEDAQGMSFIYEYSAMLLAALNALRMVDPQYSWIVPEHLTSAPKRSRVITTGMMRPSPKRKLDGDDSSAAENQATAVSDVEIIHPEDLEKMYLNAQCVAKLVFRKSSHPISLMLRSPVETFNQLVAHSLIDDAVSLANRLGLDMSHMFEDLTRRALSGPVELLQQCWSKLQSLMTRFDGAQTNYKYAIAVATTILRRDSRIKLPLWLTEAIVNSKSQDSLSNGVSELLRVYLDFDLIEESLKLAVNAFDRARQDLERLDSEKGQVLLPYSLLDRLYKRLNDVKASAAADRSGSSSYNQGLEGGKRKLDQAMNRYDEIRFRLESR